MAGISPATLIALWDTADRAPPHRRLTTLLGAIEGAGAIGGDTLGGRNRRLLLFHRALDGAPLVAHVKCAHCAVDNEFAIPADAILADPVPDPEARIRIRIDGRTLGFRLPRMRDIEAARDETGADLAGPVLERCLTSGSGPIPAPAAPRLERKFEALDPAANIVVTIACSGCAKPIAASVDPASFVARDLDRIVDLLLRDIDTIASAYGWDEAAILALPPERRRRYVAMIAARRAPARPSLAGARA